MNISIFLNHLKNSIRIILGKMAVKVKGIVLLVVRTIILIIKCIFCPVLSNEISINMPSIHAHSVVCWALSLCLCYSFVSTVELSVNEGAEPYNFVFPKTHLCFLQNIRNFLINDNYFSKWLIKKKSREMDSRLANKQKNDRKGRFE